MPDDRPPSECEEAPTPASEVPQSSDSELLPAEIEKDIESLPEAVRPPIRRIVAHFSGPLPPPSHFAQYDTVVPGAAERILSLAEQESRHRRSIEKMIAEAEVDDRVAARRERKRGQDYGLAIGLFTISAGALTACLGHPIVGTFLGTGGVLGLVTAFVYGRRQEKDDR
jgi:uncharacterized membrane protein